MISRSALAALSALLSTSAVVPALAQENPPPIAESVFDGDYITLGIGAAIGPSYEGSDDYVVFPIPALQGKVGGIGISPRPGGLALDFIDDPADARVSFQAGPVARVRFDRNRQVKDDVVERLGKRDVAVEVGGNVGVSLNQITNPYDSLTFSVDVRYDVASAHGGVVVAPGLTFQTPVSRGAFVALNVSAEHVSDRYARYYYSIGPGGSAASGLPQFDADGGWKNVGAGLAGAVDLDGDLTNGGFAIFVAANYSRLLGDFKDAPTTSIRGSANQFVGVLGVGYTF
jgi:outer membrane scaffolding protein for murein synthesis (MipA/OmpV family)